MLIISLFSIFFTPNLLLTQPHAQRAQLKRSECEDELPQ
jgi:hypothetical protein